MKITLEETAKLPLDQPCKKMLRVLVLDKRTLSSYGENKCFGKGNLADETRAIEATVYDLENFAMITTG